MNKENNTDHSPAWYITAAILLMIPMAGISIDLYVPSLPAMATALNTSNHLVKLTIPIYLIAYAIAPLIFGPWADVAGRKKPLIAGGIIYIIASLVCALSKDINTILIMRFMQGIGISGFATFGRTTLPDIYQGEALKRMNASVTMVWSLGPIIAPFIGGYLQHYIGWQANFALLALIATLSLAIGCFVPETLKKPIPFSVSYILSNYRIIAGHKLFWGSIIMMAIMYSSIVMFNVVGPFLIQKELGFSAVQFGYIALSAGIAVFVGSLSYRLLLKHFSQHKLLTVNISGAMISSIVMLIIGLLSQLNLWGLVMPIWLILFFSASLLPSAMTLFLRLFSHLAGIASALVAFSFITVTALASMLASLLKSNSQIDLAIVYVVIFIIGAWVFFKILNQHFISIPSAKK